MSELPPVFLAVWTGWSRSHRNPDLSVQWIPNQIRGFQIKSVAKLNQGDEKQKSEQQLGQGGNGAIESVWCSPLRMDTVCACKSLHGELRRKLGFAFSSKDVTLNTFD